MFTGTVPIDDLAPRESTPYVPPFGRGRYAVELTSEFEVLTGKNGWEAAKVFFANGSSLNGAPEAQEGGIVDTTFTTAHNDSKQALEIGAQQLTALAYALGIAEIVTDENGAQSATFAFEDAASAIANLEAGVGTRVGITVWHKLRDAAGTTYTDMVISQVFRLTDLDNE